MTTRRSLLAAAAGAAFGAISLSACGATAKQGGSGGGSGDGPLDGLKIMVPNSPGGGYDTTARTVAKVLEEEKLTTSIPVSNVSGAGGTVGLQRVVNDKGNGKLALQMGLGLVGAVYSEKSKAKLTATTPLVRLIEEADVLVVPKDSPYTDLAAFLKAWKADPRKIPVGGGSVPGGPDHIFPMQLAKTTGIQPRQVNYISYDGGGELLTALLGSKVHAGAAGVSEYTDQIEAGDLRVLAVSSAKRAEILPDAPTLTEEGVQLTFTNWRGLVAPPGIDDADRKAWIGALESMSRSDRWKQELKTHSWTDAFMSGEEFAGFLAEEDQKVKTILADLGLA